VKPKVHIFGHVHDCTGAAVGVTKDGSKIVFVNAAQLRSKHPIVFDYYYK